MAKRRTVITIEQHNLTVLRTRGQRLSLWCAACGKPAPSLTVEQAARALSVTQRAVFRLIENNAVHFYETTEGKLLICLESLRQLAEGLRKDEQER